MVYLASKGHEYIVAGNNPGNPLPLFRYQLSIKEIMMTINIDVYGPPIGAIYGPPVPQIGPPVDISGPPTTI